MSHLTPDLTPQSVATLGNASLVYCPVCHTVSLQGKQTVCSPKCRIQRSMQRRAAKRQDDLAKVRLLLTEALGLLKK